jgi:glycolate oxidase iron-sulfur subunit
MKSTEKTSAPVNSKTEILQKLTGELANMDSCIRCGLCHSVCPTYQETHLEEESPRGRIAMAKALTEGHIEFSHDLIVHEESCLMCDACTEICPAGFNMETLGLALRADFRAQNKNIHRINRLLLFPLTKLSLLQIIANGLKTFQKLGLTALIKKSKILNLLGADHLEKLIPDINGSFLFGNGQAWETTNPKGQITLVTGCVMGAAFPNVHRAAIRLLNAMGYSVIAPPQGCCGAVHAHNGFDEDAQEMARSNIDAFNETEGPILVDASGCTAHLKNYPVILRNDPVYSKRAEHFSKRILDATEFFAPLVKGLPLKELPRKVVYQEACHLANMQKIREQPRQILNAIPGIEIQEMTEPTMCCGSAGIYNILEPEMAGKLGARKANSVRETLATIVVTTNPGCHLQLESHLANAQVRVAHILELLDEAYMYAPNNDAYAPEGNAAL